MQELFGFSPLEEDIEDDLEFVAAASEVVKDAAKPRGQAAPARTGLGYILASLGIAALSMGLAWFRC